MRQLDKLYIKYPFYGARKMAACLSKPNMPVGRNRAGRLMKLMGIEAIYRKPRTSKPSPEHETYPYLLRGLVIDRPNQVWATDITYIPLLHGFAYLVAVMDWYSRYVLSWRLSNTLDSSFCVEALQEALERFGRPDIFNSDQGSQFTSKSFTDVLKAREVSISMDGRGRCFDNIFVERLWRSVKYEDVYLRDYQSMPEAAHGLGCYFDFYDHERIHAALGYQTPAAVYLEHASI
jgi:putative transposase